MSTKGESKKRTSRQVAKEPTPSAEPVVKQSGEKSVSVRPDMTKSILGMLNKLKPAPARTKNAAPPAAKVNSDIFDRIKLVSVNKESGEKKNKNTKKDDEWGDDGPPSGEKPKF